LLGHCPQKADLRIEKPAGAAGIDFPARNLCLKKPNAIALGGQANGTITATKPADR
jgi:hypothetical protein